MSKQVHLGYIKFSKYLVNKIEIAYHKTILYQIQNVLKSSVIYLRYLFGIISTVWNFTQRPELNLLKIWDEI